MILLINLVLSFEPAFEVVMDQEESRDRSTPWVALPRLFGNERDNGQRTNENEQE